MIWDLDGASSSPDSTSMDLVDTDLVEALEITRWQVPRTRANSLQNSVNEHCRIWINRVLAIDALLQSKS